MIYQTFSHHIAVKRIDRYPINAIGLMPGRNKGRILEIVSTMKLRKFLGLKNGKEVMLSVGGEDSKERRRGCVRGEDFEV